MLRLPSICLALLLIAWLEFEYFPGHTFLAGGTQVYVPMLEHLQFPAYLTRDLVATHPNLTYTIYDELTFFFQRIARGDLEHALATQQIASRLAGVAGSYLLARAARISQLPALVVTAVIAAGTFLPGVGVWTTDSEPTPRSLAFGFTVLAIGLFTRQAFIFASLAGGLALLLDATAAAPFWLLAGCCAVFDREMRRTLRPLVPILLVFILLLANMSQLQTGTPDAQPNLVRIPGAIARIQQFRSPELWVSRWYSGWVYFYLGLWVVSIWAATRISQNISRATIWALMLLPFLGILSLAFSFAFLDRLRWAFVLRLRPLELLAYAVLIAWLSVIAAGLQAWARRARAEAAVWAALGIFLLSGWLLGTRPTVEDFALDDLAAWAASGTWGSSMFAFPDAGRALYPGVFRARSLRAVWIDWEGGRQIDDVMALAPIWQQRWTETMNGPLSGDHLQSMLTLPVDYYVFRAGHKIETLLEGKTTPVPPAYVNAAFRVYDASTLRLIPGRLLLR